MLMFCFVVVILCSFRAGGRDNGQLFARYVHANGFKIEYLNSTLNISKRYLLDNLEICVRDFVPFTGNY